jgi:hypothetical protein
MRLSSIYGLRGDDAKQIVLSAILIDSGIKSLRCQSALFRYTALVYRKESNLYSKLFYKIDTSREFVKVCC